MTGRVLHTVQAIADIVMGVPSLPPRGGDIFATDSLLTAGGGFNLVAAAARDGADVVHLGVVGTGPFGATVAAAFAREGVRLSAAPIPGRDSGFSIVLVEPDAERTFISSHGAEDEVSVELLQHASAAPGDVVCISGYSLLGGAIRDAILTWLPTLPDRVMVLFDPSPLITDLDDEVWRAMTNRADVWTLNAREATLAAQRFARGRPDTSAAAGPATASYQVTDLAATLASDLRAALVRDGARGAVVASVRNVTHIPAYPVTAVDTTGAGDTHTGVLAAALARGSTLTDAVRRANAAAAIAVTRPGPATAPIRSETDRLLTGA